MSRLVSLLKQVGRKTPDDETINRIISLGKIGVIQKNRLLGEVLLQVSIELAPELEGTLGLFWQQNQIILKINPQQLSALTSDELVILLEHEALHILWQHPLRYANSADQDLVTIATDVAVNQYLLEHPLGTMTLSRLQQITHQSIPSKQDSSYYLEFLRKLPINTRKKLHCKLQGVNEHDAKQAINPQKHQETHAGWIENSHLGIQSNQQLRIAQIKKIVKHAWLRTPKKDRGLLPGDLDEPLEMNREVRKPFAWQRLLKRQLGTLAAGQKEAFYRFNRHQPWRMDLPGKITRMIPKLMIFVDNSGSVSDVELLKTLSEINQLGQFYNFPALVYPFDARVHIDECQRMKAHQRVQFKRIGGGGTSFQCIFDFLHNSHVNPATTLVVIITDGWGEEIIHYYNFYQINWLLLNDKNNLSVKKPVGHVLSIKRGTYE